MADKVTIKEFAEKLKDYANGGAARKAIGRFSGWSDREKARARNMVEEHFGDDPAATKVATKSPRKAAKAPKPVRQAKRAFKATQVPQDDGPLAILRGVRVVQDELSKVERLIQDNAMVTSTLRQVHEMHPTMPLGDALQQSVAVSNYALSVLSKELSVPMDEVKAQAPAAKPSSPKKKAPPVEARGGNGGSKPALPLIPETDELAAAPPPVHTQI